MIARPASFAREALAPAVEGRLSPGRSSRDGVDGVCTDTRDPLEGALFIALVGERFDAHTFLGQAVDAGASTVMVSETGFAAAGGRDAVGAEVDVLFVDDTLRGLGRLARAHRRAVGTPVLALTGSNGKTTTKEMIAALTGVERCVLATEGNLNNLVGLPLTLLGLHSSHELCVAEMGMNARGEIARMTEIAEPEVGLVTNVGPAHIGELGSMDAIEAAKGELFAGMTSNATAVMNGDDERVVRQGRLSPARRKLTFGADAQADVRLVSAERAGDGQRVVLRDGRGEHTLELASPGAHNAMNLAGAWAATLALRPPPSPVEARAGLAAWGGVKGRLTVRVIGAVTVIDDSYNANAASAIAALHAASELADGRRLVAAFGEMNELGTFGAEAHREVAQMMATLGFEVVATFGSGAAEMASISRALHAHHEDQDMAALAGWLRSKLRANDVVVVKGSRASRMERVVAAIEEGA